MFWRDNLAIAMRASFLSRGNNQYVCRSAMLDVGLDMPDPGFVPDGAKCEDNKVTFVCHKCPIFTLMMCIVLIQLLYGIKQILAYSRSRFFHLEG